MLTFVQVCHYKPSQRRATTLSIVRSCQASERSATAVRFQQRVVVLSTNPWANPRFPLYESSCVPSEKNCFKGKNRRSTKHASKAKTDRRTTKNMVQRPKQTQHKGKHSGWLLRSSWQGRKQGDQDKVSATTMHTGLRPCVVTELSCRASHHDYVSQGGRGNAHFQTVVASRWKRSCEIPSPPIVDDSSFVCFHWRAASLAALCCACRLLVRHLCCAELSRRVHVAKLVPELLARQFSFCRARVLWRHHRSQCPCDINICRAQSYCVERNTISIHPTCPCGIIFHLHYIPSAVDDTDPPKGTLKRGLRRMVTWY